MWILIFEAFAAAGLLAFIVWWTMFSGRRAGERVDAGAEHATEVPPPDAER